MKKGVFFLVKDKTLIGLSRMFFLEVPNKNPNKKA